MGVSCHLKATIWETMSRTMTHANRISLKSYNKSWISQIRVWMRHKRGNIRSIVTGWSPFCLPFYVKLRKRPVCIHVCEIFTWGDNPFNFVTWIVFVVSFGILIWEVEWEPITSQHDVFVFLFNKIAILLSDYFFSVSLSPIREYFSHVKCLVFSFITSQHTRRRSTRSAIDAFGQYVDCRGRCRARKGRWRKCSCFRIGSHW